MKKITILLIFGLIGFIPHAKSQKFIASFGISQGWDIPYFVYDVVDYDYYDYDWVHAKRFYRNGYLAFEVILQRGDIFVELHIDHHRRIFKTIRFTSYPLHNHICDRYCGYHSNYYSTYYVTCSSHHHHGHNHVIYRPYVTRHYYGHGGYYSYGKKYNGHGHKHNNNSHRTYNSKHDHGHYNYPRRGRYVESNHNNRGRSTYSNNNSRHDKHNNRREHVKRDDDRSGGRNSGSDNNSKNSRSGRSRGN